MKQEHFALEQLNTHFTTIDPAAPFDIIIPHFKNSLKKEQRLLRDFHRSGVSGRAVIKAHAGFFDIVLQTAYSIVFTQFLPAGFQSPCAIIGLGGYGRGEMNPKSDLDILLLHPDNSGEHIMKFLEQYMYFMWDTGLHVGHSVRTISECIEKAKEQLETKTALLESRFIIGDRNLFQKYYTELYTFIKKNRLSDFLQAKIHEKDRRYKQHDNSIYVQEPNVKEGAGGLRDVHLVLWAAKALYNCSTIPALYKNQLCTHEEFLSLQKAFDFLHRLRNELHFSSAVTKDVLTFSDQKPVAQALGYTGTQRVSAAEQLMREYYLHARAIHVYLQDFLRDVQRHIQPKPFLASAKRRMSLGDGFILLDMRELDVESHMQPFAEEPLLMMKTFYLQQRYQCLLHTNLKNRIRSSLHAVNRKFRTDPEITGLFKTIIGQRYYVSQVLRTMHDLGFLGKFIPEFGKTTCFVLYDYNHRYTIDEHSLIGAENVDQLIYEKDESLQSLSGLFRSAGNLHLLRLAFLMHDAGKVEGQGHIEIGVSMIPKLAKRLHLNREETDHLEFLVRHHETMSRYVQLRNLDDDETISNFSNIVATVERLDHLYLFTYGDMRAVAPNVWTEWKGTLLKEMYRRTLDYITLPDYQEHLSRFIAELRMQLLAEKTKLYSSKDVHKHLDWMHPNYLSSTPKNVLQHHLAMINQLQKQRIVTRYHHPKEASYPTATICTTDQLGIFAKIAGILTYHKINILSASLYTRKDGVVLDTFKLKTPISTEQWGQLNASLNDYIGEDNDIAPLFETDRRYLKLKRKGKLLVHTSITFDQDLSSHYTIMDVHTHDRKGLLYHISKTIADHDLSIQYAKIFTEGDRALDAFYLTTPDGSKITDDHCLHTLKSSLKKSLRALPEEE